MILSIERGHVLFDFANFSEYEKITYNVVNNPDWSRLDEFRRKMLDHIDIIKRWGPNGRGSHAPLFISLSHHFWSLLSGHA